MFSTDVFFWKDAPLHERKGQKIRYQCKLPRVINDLEENGFYILSKAKITQYSLSYNNSTSFQMSITLLVVTFSIIGEYE